MRRRIKLNRKLESGNGKLKAAQQEPIEEGIRRKQKQYSSEETGEIKRMRMQLMSEGLCDGKISRIISQRLGRTPGSVRGRIIHLRKKGDILENPNKRGWSIFCDEEIETIARMRNELASIGLTDGEIAKKIAKELGRGVGSIGTKLSELERKGSIPINENKQGFSDQEIGTVMKLRNVLKAKGYSDRAIAKKIAKESRKGFEAIYAKIRRLVKDGVLSENPNKQRKFTDQDLEYIKRRRAELVEEGYADTNIASSVAEEMEASKGTVDIIIRNLVDNSEINENPNKEKKYTAEEVKTIIAMREILISEGLNDKSIAEKIGKKLGRSTNGVYSKIQQLKNKGRINENRNKQKKRQRGMYKRLNDKDLLELSREFIQNNDISGRSELYQENSILYLELLSRRILDRLDFRTRYRKWSMMSDEEVVEHTRKFMNEKGMGSRVELQKADGGLYYVLRNRKLLDLVFSEIEQSKQQTFKQQLLAGLAQAADAMEAFGERR